MLLAPMLPLLAEVVGSPPARVVDTTPVIEAPLYVNTPDVVLPAMLPYVSCLVTMRGLPLVVHGQRVDGKTTSGDCSAKRARARAEALNLLSGKPAPGGVSKSAFVDSVLANIDASASRLPTTIGDKSHRTTSVVGISFFIQDEVRPAYERYEDCLKTQVGSTEVSSVTVQTVFRRILDICWSVREASVQEATNALKKKKGWDATTSAREAESTFANADRSWLETGRQFQDSLAARFARSKRK